jgi:hypothetical protein
MLPPPSGISVPVIGWLPLDAGERGYPGRRPRAAAPPAGELARFWAIGQRSGTGGTERLQEQREVAVPKRVPAAGAWQGDRAEHLQEEDDVEGADVVAEHLVALRRPVHLACQCAGPLGERGQLRCRVKVPARRWARAWLPPSRIRVRQPE